MPAERQTSLREQRRQQDRPVPGKSGIEKEIIDDDD